MRHQSDSITTTFIRTQSIAPCNDILSEALNDSQLRFVATFQQANSLETIFLSRSRRGWEMRSSFFLSFLKNPPFIPARNSLPSRHLSSNAIKRFFLAFLHISWANGENPLFRVGRIFLNALIASICKKAEEKLEMIFYFFV